MMISQNSWSAGERADVGIVTATVPGTNTRLPVRGGDVATVLLWVATRWHNEIEPLVEPGNWGYAYRAVRGTDTGLSNHASGTAIDLNAPAHPLGTDPAQTMTKAQIATAKRIEADSGGVVRWGGSYTGRKDPMHWEINAPAAAVAAFAARITRGEVPAPTPIEEPDLDADQNNRLTEAWLNSVAAKDNAAAAARLAQENVNWIVDPNRGVLMQLGALARAVAADRDDVDEQALAAAVSASLVPAVVSALASQSAGLTEEQVKAATVAAVRRVFADAAGS